MTTQTIVGHAAADDALDADLSRDRGSPPSTRNRASSEFLHSMRDITKAVQFLVSPVDGHFPYDPARTADVFARWMNHIGDHFTL
jgi:hypothetical protein